MPAVRMVKVVHRGRPQQEPDLVFRHADFELIDQSCIDAIALRYILSIHATLKCYNEDSSNED